MRTQRQLVKALIEYLTEKLTREGDPAYAAFMVQNDQGTIDDGGQYGDPLTVNRPDCLQAAYDDLPGMVGGGDEWR